MIDNENSCPLCRKTAIIEFTTHTDKYFVQCEICGRYCIEFTLMMFLQKQTTFQNPAMVSAYTRARTIRNRPDVILTSSYEGTFGERPHLTLEQITTSFPTTISERLDRALLNLAKLSHYAGQKINITDKDYPLFYVETVENAMTELRFMTQQMMDDDYILSKSGAVVFPQEYWITVKGWNRIIDLERGAVESNQAFIAMWFDESVSVKPFESAIEDAGYHPLRIDQKEHVNQISDEIIAEIRRSKFVVADFTGGRGGVYYEAGFAMGLGLPVIWTCRKDFESKLHFDIRQYNNIFWETEDELKKKLYNRIRAVIL